MVFAAQSTMQSLSFQGSALFSTNINQFLPSPNAHEAGIGSCQEKND
jgi:hypothetical protein